MLSSSTMRTVVISLVLLRLDYMNSVLTGLPAYLVKCLQSVLNALARLVYGLRRFNLVPETLMSLHSLRISERIQFKLTVLVHRAVHGNALDYFGPFTRLYDITSRLSLCSASSHHLLILPFRRSTVSARAFLVSGPALWYSLPADSPSTVCQSFVIVSKLFVLALVSRRRSITVFLFLSWSRSFIYYT